MSAVLGAFIGVTIAGVFYKKLSATFCYIVAAIVALAVDLLLSLIIW